MDEKILKSFKESIFGNFEDFLKETVEFGIDNIFENKLLNSIPIVSMISGVCKTGLNLKERKLLKNTMIFLVEFNNGTINRDRLIAYTTKLEHNDRKCNHEVERVLLLLNSYLDSEKAKMLAKIYKNYINEFITNEIFIEYSEIIDRLYYVDIENIKKIHNKDISSCESYQIDRLAFLGLIELALDAGTIDNIIMNNETELHFNDRNFTELGKNFYKNAIE